MKTPIRIARGTSAALPRAEPNPSHQVVAQYRGPNVGVKAFLTFPPATIIDASTSTNNQDGKRDPQMHQTKKGNEWYFGMKAHIGVGSQSKLIHSVAATAANVHDSQWLGDLLHGEQTRVWGDSAYSGQGDTLAECAPRALDFTNRKASRNRPLTEEDRSKNRSKSRVRAKVVLRKIV